MQRLMISDSFVNIEINTNIKYFSEVINKYLKVFFEIKKCVDKVDKKPDIKIIIVLSNENLASKVCIYSDEDIRIYKDNKVLIVNLKILNKETEVFLKRLIINVYAKLMENKNSIFLHGSSIKFKNGKSIIFIGDSGAGKTHNMLYLLQKGDFSYVSNDKVII